jgi:thymidine kinase
MSLTLIVGPMFAGKTGRLLSLATRYTSLGMRVLVLTHSSDTRYGQEPAVVTHDGRRIPCRRIRTFNEIGDETLWQFDVVLVDEAHFFTGLVAFARRVVEDHRKPLVLVGLDGDSARQPFGELLHCLPLADTIERLTALCRRCADGTLGLFTFRHQGPHDQQVLVGGSERYETLCRRCYRRAEERAGRAE